MDPNAPGPVDPAEEPELSDQEDSGAAVGGKPARKAFLLRLPPELMDELKAWASQDLRSLNAHIEYLLREAVRRRRGR